MTLALARQPWDADTDDLDAVLAALHTQIAGEITRDGEPHPRVLLVSDGHLDTLDLHEFTRRQPEAHLGATIRLLRSDPEVTHTFVLVQLHATLSGDVCQYALLVEVTDEGTAAWMLPYTPDPRNGVGHTGDWALVDDGMAAALPILHDLVDIPPGAKPGDLLRARRPQVDVRAAFFELPEALPLPVDLADLVDLTARVAGDGLLSGELRGTVLFKHQGKAAEIWTIGHAEGDLDDIARAIASREPVADELAVAVLALFEGAQPPEKGLQIVAERAGQRLERWYLLDFPQGPAERPVIGRTLERRVDVDPDEGWLGVEPALPMSFYALGPEA